MTLYLTKYNNYYYSISSCSFLLLISYFSISMRTLLLLPLVLISFIPLAQTFAYPGCDQSDILIGGQVWASCNATAQSKGSSAKSGWFFAGDKSPSFIAYNGVDQRLSFQGKNRKQDWWWTVGPCAKGYKLPTRGDFETAIYYSELNNIALARLIALPENGGYRTYRDSDGDIMVEARTQVTGAYWTSTKEDIYGLRNIVMHLGESYSGRRMDGTNGVYSYEKLTWQYDDAGLELVWGEVTEMANIRCIRS